MIADYVSYEMIAITMFATMLLMLLTGQRVFGAIGFVAAMAALLLWGDGAVQMPYTASWKLFKWYPMLTLPLFIYMGYMICLLYTSPSPRDATLSRMPSSA